MGGDGRTKTWSGKRAGISKGEGARIVQAAKSGAEIGAGFTPAGVALDVRDLKQSIENRDGIGSVLAAAGFVPGIGFDIASSSDNELLSNVFTNLLSAAENEGSR